MDSLPKSVLNYASTPVFTEKNIPEMLQESHRTKANTWARIVVCEGLLLFCVLEPEVCTTTLEPGVAGIVEPEVAHYVRPMGKVRFHIEFHR